VAKALQLLYDKLLQWETAVIRAYRDPHRLTLSRR
jgi:hypothetical protein